MADDRCQRCGTGLDGTEDAFPWCDLCWQEMHSGSDLSKDDVIAGILDAQTKAKIMTCELPECDNEASETFEVRAGAPISMMVCPGHADDLETGLTSGSWSINDGLMRRHPRLVSAVGSTG